MSFVQTAPQIGNQYRDDAMLRSTLRRLLAPEALAAIESDLLALGNNAIEAWRSVRERVPEEPALTQWDVWGNRIDRVELTRAWRTAQPLAARFGLVAAGHEPTLGAAARIHQFALVYLFHCPSEFYTCPLAMSDGAATVLKGAPDSAAAQRALPRLVSRDPTTHWVSGQWMTETPGGSDVSRTETVAREVDGQWRLYGRKWFTSAINAQMALALARPEGAADGADALALFYVEPRDAQGRWQGVQVDRLKHKLGTRELPTAEIHLDGVPALRIGAATNGVRAIAPMLNVTRTWNAMCAVATMRRALTLAQDFSRRREAFGKPLAAQPLHRATVALLDAQCQAAFQLVFHVVGLLGRCEHGAAAQGEAALLRLLTPLIKLWTGKLAVSVTSEACESLGGAGYLEETGLPQLLRDAQVFPIWEGTTNVLALDFLRALRGSGGFGVLTAALGALAAEVHDPLFADAVAQARVRMDRIAARLAELAPDADALEAAARQIALATAESFALVALARHADYSRQHGDEPRSVDATLAFAASIAPSPC